MASAAGDALVPVALAFAVLSVRHSATALGGVLAAFTIARVVFTLQKIDRIAISCLWFETGNVSDP